MPPAEEPPINEGDFTITPDMTQEEVDTAVNNATGIITVQAGNYSDEQDEKQYHKAIIVTKDQSVVELNGNYTRFQIIVRAENCNFEMYWKYDAYRPSQHSIQSRSGYSDSSRLIKY